MKHRGIQISFLVLCAEIVEFIISNCFTGYVNFFDLKLNYFVNSFFFPYIEMFYMTLYKKKTHCATEFTTLQLMYLN